MLSVIKYRVKKSWPGFLKKPIIGIFRICRSFFYNADMVLNSNKMRFSCPCCGIKCRAFVAGDYLDRPNRFNHARYEGVYQNVLCPVCRSLPRHRILTLWLIRNRELLSSSEIILFAPERCIEMWLNRNGIHYVTADLYGPADMKLDIQRTGLANDSYDVIVCNHVLEHVDDFHEALNEMYRVLRPGGSFICSFPMDPKVELLDEDKTVCSDEIRLLKYGQNDHKRVFGMKADSFLRESGFVVKRIDGQKCPDRIMPVVGPADYDINIIFRCIKPCSQ